MALSEFRQIPGVGSDMEAHLMSLGLTNLAELAKENPEELYTRDCLQFGQLRRLLRPHPGRTP